MVCRCNSNNTKVQCIFPRTSRFTTVSLLAEPIHLRFVRDEAPESGRGLGLTRPANILLYLWRGDSHFCLDLVRSHLLEVVGGMLPLLSHQLSKASGISIQPFSCTMALTPFLLAFPLKELSVLRLRSCSYVFVSGTDYTHGSLSGRPMLGCSAGSPVQLCEGFQSILLLDICRSVLGCFHGSLVAFVSWVVSRFWARCADPCYFYSYLKKQIDHVAIKFIILKFELSITHRRKTYDNS